MYNTYFSSAVLTLRSKNPFSFPFNDYSNSLIERFDTNPSSSQCCACCNCCSCSFPSNRSLINPNLFYGLRQSTLIQWSPCRRLIWDPYSYRVPNLDHTCFDFCSEKCGSEGIQKRRKDRIGRFKLQKRRCLSSADDAEAVIRFLSEECLGDRDRNRGFRKRVEIERRLSQFESAKSKKEDYRRKEEPEEREEYRNKEVRDDKEERRIVLRGENHREKKPSSSCSSYYSVSSAQDENVGLLEASSSGYNRDSWCREDKFEEEREDFERKRGMEQKTSADRTSVDWEMREKSEKKLTEIQETHSQRESSRLNSKTVRTSGSDCGKTSSFDKEFVDAQGKISMAADFEEAGRKQYFRKGDQEITDINAKRSSQNESQFIGREKENSTVDTSTEMGTARNSQQKSQVSETGNNVKRDTKLQSLSESRMKIRDVDVALRSKRQQAFKQITEQIESRSASKHLSEISKVNDSNSRKSSILQSQNKTKNDEGSSSFVPHSAEKTKEQRFHEDQKAAHSSEDVTNIAVNVTNVSITQATDIETVNYTQVASEKMTDQSKPINVEEMGYISSQPTMMPPSRQTVDRGSFRADSVSGIATQEGRIQQEPYGRDSREKIVVSPDDTMVSVQLLEGSSNKFVGEYIDMAWNEALTSEISEDKKNILSQFGSEAKISGASGAKGPSDKMWDEAGPSAQEPPKTEEPEDSTTIMNTNTVVKRSGRSLWGVISDVVRFRWGPRVETPKSSKKSGGKNSSNDSVSIEAWFSEEAASSHHQQSLQASVPSQREVSDTLSSKSITRQPETNATSPSSTYLSGSTSKGVSSPAEEETQSLHGKSSHVSPPSRDELSVLPLASSRTDVSGSGALEIKEDHFIAKPVEVLGYEGKDGELKQRKLKRNKQVLKDKFDEWEEAYNQESEQRRIDELFMREALLEAKKGADTWEVPVGAVLVQHGKIIARGYNLVEELRDSTAHAEMICIREASKQLRSWRLAESTLYVTLEPCAMCAGAILQARIDTLVWGAPNKLLGADGSWIRLFPNTGGSDTDVRGDKLAAPPHPFHPKMTIRRGIMESECAAVMQQFFQLRRRKKAKSEDSPPQPSLPIATHQSKFLRKMHDIFHAFLCL